MKDTANNLAFLSRKVTSLEKRVQSLEATVAENTVLIERLSELIDLTLTNQEYFKKNVVENNLCETALKKYFGSTCAIQ